MTGGRPAVTTLGRAGFPPLDEIRGPAFATSRGAGGLTAIGGWLSAAASTSWLPMNGHGWFPVPCYLLRSGSKAVLIDTGLAIHHDAVRSGLSGTLAPGATLDVLLTRREPDMLMNLPWIVRSYGVASVRCSGPVDPFDYVEKLEEAMTAEQMRAIVGVPVEFLAPSGTVELGAFSFELIRPAIRVLATDWLYERTTRTLFSSDMWAFVSAPAPHDVVCPVPDERIDVERILNHLRAKFDWLEGIDTAPISSKLTESVAGRDIERICPSYGCVIEGREAVETLFSNTIEALARLKS